MRQVDEIDQVLARAETRIDIEKILDPITMIGVEVPALPEYRAQPQCRDPEIGEIVQLARDPL
jgi:hypothetical protein